MVSCQLSHYNDMRIERVLMSALVDLFRPEVYEVTSDVGAYAGVARRHYPFCDGTPSPFV